MNDATAIEVPCGSDGWLAPAGAIVLACPPGTTRVRLAATAAAHAAALPDLLAALGVTAIAVPGAAPGPWRGPRGGVLERLPLPPVPDRDHHATALDPVAAARALALRAWAPPLPASDGALAAAANPFLQARTQVVQLPWTGAAPPALVDDAGARHPAQPWEEGVLCALPLPGLGATRLRPQAHPVAGCAWEASPQVLDNGRVRAELDADGHLVRLCVGSTFAAWTAPALQVRAGERPLGSAQVRLTAAGPVRAQLTLTRPEVVLTLTLDAHADLLQLHATPSVPGLSLTLPVERPLPPRCWDGLGAPQPWTTAASAGRSWAWLDGQGTGLVLVAGSGQHLQHAPAGDAIALGSGTRFSLGVARGWARPGAWWDPHTLVVPHRAIRGDEPPPPPPLRAALPPGVLASWCAWDAHGGAVVLQDLAGARTRFPLVRSSRGPLRVGLLGQPPTMVEDAGEGCVVTLPAHGILIARWSA